MPRPTSCTCTRCARDSMRCWRANTAPNWRAAALISCRHAPCLISKAGRSKTSSRISLRARGPARSRAATSAGGVGLGAEAIAAALDRALSSVTPFLAFPGEAAAWPDISAYPRRFKIPLVAITGGRRSTLAEAADVVLMLPPAAEACPMGLAPTTSTTMMIALGDALAIALLERKGFSPADFQRFHPGGKLGRKLLRVGEIMHKGDSVPLVAPDALMSEAILVMSAKSFGCVGGAGANGTLVGVITDGDLRRHMNDGLLARSVDEIRPKDPKTITAA